MKEFDDGQCAATMRGMETTKQQLGLLRIGGLVNGYQHSNKLLKNEVTLHAAAILGAQVSVTSLPTASWTVSR